MINQFDLSNRTLLEGLQGNILKAHGRRHTANVFIRCNGGKQDKAKAWLESLVNGEKSMVQSAYDQLRTNVLFKESKADIDTGLFACIHISAIGYDYLFGEKVMDRFEDEPFKRGMQNRKTQLNDPDFNDWETGLKADNHFMLLLAHADTNQLDKAIERVYLETDAFSSITTIEMGNALLNKAGDGIEHFGYVDGISQPLFFEDEWETYKTNNAIKDEAKDIKFDPRAPKELVLIQDPFAPKNKDGSIDENALGSYFVFRKLEQNVKGFKLAESQLSDRLELKEGDEERAGAMLVGRFEDGTPTELSEEEGQIRSAVSNNFDYDIDNASRCPFHGHIRKTNPRSGLKDAGDTPEKRMEAAKKRIMARRGITYGVRTDDPNDGHIHNKPEKDIGLLFMSYQANIEKQFEFIQTNWANSPTFPSNQPKGPGKIGIDPVIGQGDRRIEGSFATTWSNPTTMKSTSFGQFVHLKGGQYFFAPSMAFMKNILHTITNPPIS